MSPTTRRWISWVMVLLGMVTMNEAMEPARGQQPRAGRSVTIARHGMVATSHPLASLVGVEMLKSGGNAADAAIAASAMLGVVEPMSCGIGGDLFVLYWDNKAGKLYGLNASGRSPFSLNRDHFKEKGMDQIPLHGPLSWSVPGCVSGWEELRSRFGSKGFDQILEPSIRYATEGFGVTEVIAGYWKASEKGLSQWPDSAKTFLNAQGRAPRAGEIFANPNLAATYRQIAREGAKAFYHGSIARRIADYSKASGGHLAFKDFERHKSDWIEPVSTLYRGIEIFELPPNGQGIAALQMLNILEGYDLPKMGPAGADYLHLLVEAKKLAFADRARYYADPAFSDPPVKRLISKPYADRRRAMIDPAKALTAIEPGDEKLLHGDTIYLSVVDKDRNACSLIQSNYYGFGSQMVPGDLGFALQNRGSLFSLEENHPNRLEPHKRPFHTIIPAMAFKGGRPWVVFGVMGGDMQPQGHVQVMVNLIDFKMNLQEAGEALRVRHDGSATPTGIKARGGGTVILERGHAQNVIDDLQKRGHHVLISSEGAGFGGYQAVLIDWEGGLLQGASENRKDGMAIGY